MKKAILITHTRQDAQNEALGLCDAAGYRIIHVMQQRYLRRPKYGIGSGALEDLIGMIEEEEGPDVIIYDEILKPSQNYNLASATRREILDRETLILEIFERRASSAESRLQVKLAQLRYEMARARERVRLSSMGEQPGFMGIGKFGVDVYYNDIKNRMNATRAKLEKSGRQRELHRSARRRAGFRTISLAGYTSAGKTTLFNAMAGEDKDMGDEMFTTLSTTTRRIAIGADADVTAAVAARRGMAPDADAALISDTVGFISRLPAYMIDAFRSTLEELVHADVVILVIDASDDARTLRRKVASCRSTLAEIGVRDGRIIYALNKSDAAGGDEAGIVQKAEELGIAAQGVRRWVAVSARTGKNIDELKLQIRGMLATRDARAREHDIRGHAEKDDGSGAVRRADIGWSESEDA